MILSIAPARHRKYPEALALTRLSRKLFLTTYNTDFNTPFLKKIPEKIENFKIPKLNVIFFSKCYKNLTRKLFFKNTSIKK